jgi:hypothetical protein
LIRETHVAADPDNRAVPLIDRGDRLVLDMIDIGLGRLPEPSVRAWARGIARAGTPE